MLFVRMSHLRSPSHLVTMAAASSFVVSGATLHQSRNHMHTASIVLGGEGVGACRINECDDEARPCGEGSRLLCLTDMALVSMQVNSPDECARLEQVEVKPELCGPGSLVRCGIEFPTLGPCSGRTDRQPLVA